MSSDVDICNLALSHLGDTATVASISPPEGSAQAEHCARFYPIARDGLLEMHAWGFATRRTPLALLANPPASTWRYAYGVPADLLNALAVYGQNAEDDISAHGLLTPQTFVIETEENGNSALLTDQPRAVLHYTVRVNDSERFPPLFVTTLALYLASMLAGPVIKGDAGAAMAQNLMKVMLAFLNKAAVADANQRRETATPLPDFILGRR
jgi:hypothetical protein